MDELRARIEKLETQNRWMKRLGIAAFLCVAVTIFIAADSPVKDIRCDTITTNNLRLVDSKGKLQANFKARGNGPRLSFFDSNETIRASFEIFKNHPSLSLWDSNETIRASFRVNDDGPALLLWDSNETIRATFRVDDVDDKHGPRLAFKDSKGRLQAIYDPTGYRKF